MARAREFLNDEQVMQEIERLKHSEFVKLSQKEFRLKAERMRKSMYQLRWHEKRGKELAAAGVTMDNMEAWMQAMDAGTDGPQEAEE